MTHPNLLSTLKELESISGSFYILAPERYLSSENRWQSYDPREESSFSYSNLETTHRLIGYGNLSPVEIVERISAQRLWPICTLVFCPDYFSSGDYGGSLVELSNMQTFIEDYKHKQGIWELYGSYGSSGLALDIRSVDAEILEDLSALQSYLVRSEDHLSALELDKESEAWDAYISSDFKRSLERKLPDLFSSVSEAQLDTLSEALDNLPDSELFNLCSELAEQTNTYWETEAISRWIDCDRLAEGWDADDALSLLLPYCSADLGELATQQELSV